ncbi:TetR/AcrR family transcriptional regulator [Streptomyces sp. NPDC059679]|uniref:TetR/AcrR family transcriptional regulator n=1 Tax=Streptomyces sp. NPDC059679 TaxID=3346903 RepID=UPI003687F35B
MSKSSTTTVIERADAARNRQLLLNTVREMITETGVEQVTMDGLAERAGVGKGTVFRRFRSRAGIFHALLDDDDRAFRERVLYGPHPWAPAQCRPPDWRPTAVPASGSYWNVMPSPAPPWITTSRFPPGSRPCPRSISACFLGRPGSTLRTSTASPCS